MVLIVERYVASRSTLSSDFPDPAYFRLCCAAYLSKYASVANVVLASRACVRAQSGCDGRGAIRLLQSAKCRLSGQSRELRTRIALRRLGERREVDVGRERHALCVDGQDVFSPF